MNPCPSARPGVQAEGRLRGDPAAGRSPKLGGRRSEARLGAEPQAFCVRLSLATLAFAKRARARATSPVATPRLRHGPADGGLDRADLARARARAEQGA
jgi:hypothetical protein